MNLEEQLEVLDEFASSGLGLLGIMTDTYKSTLMAHARKRLIEGFELYGEESFAKTQSDLFKDIVEEIADAIVYAAILTWKYRKGE